ncbi:MAG: sugar kinase [Armatimonadota bacterium]|nr:sugar kinase [Armatimonadota bacterium]MDR7549815.1 sugar kinase [Armatimonadota bacterium]
MGWTVVPRTEGPAGTDVPEIVALGEPMAEFAAVERGRLSTVTTFRRGFGGDTSNFVVAAARLGGRCGYITRLGDDEFGRAFLDLWHREGIDTSRVVVEPDGFTGVYFTALAEDGSHSFIYYRAGSAASRLGPADISVDYLATARLVHTSGITLAISESARAAAEAMVEAARRCGVMVSFDANVRPRLLDLRRLGPIVEETMGKADLVFLSAEDADHLYGPLSPARVVERVLAGGARIVAFKLGADGCLVAGADGSRWAVPSWPVEPVDATGAGDAFDAAFVIQWLRGVPPEEAARFANAVGALVASGLGAVDPIPTRSQVEAFMEGARAAPRQAAGPLGGTGRRGGGRKS